MNHAPDRPAPPGSKRRDGAKALAEPSAPIAHVTQDPVDGSWKTHPLHEHLKETAEMAGAFARPFHSDSWAHLAGQLHDLGKYGPDFQRYLKTASGYDPTAHMEGMGEKVDHSSAGGLWAVASLGPAGRILAYLVAGHHAGLLDWRSPSGACLEARLAKQERLSQALLGAREKDLPEKVSPAQRPCVEGPQDAHLWIRMLFSCLADADFLDTEAFMAPGKAAARDAKGLQPQELLAKLNAFLHGLAERAAPTEVNRVRQEVLAACREGSALEPGLFSLTVPTGGGKTLASMAFALEHAVRHGKHRVMVVVPYTSIIEQTAETLATVFGPGVVLEHHSNLDPARETVESRLATENWDAPVIVTTNVQFFESLFAARTSACRKLHNLVDSVVIFDEAQMLPSAYLKPILAALQSLVRHYGMTAVLCTATQPALQGRIGSQKAAFQGLDGVRELMANPSVLARRLERVDVCLQNADLQPVAWVDLAAQLVAYPQVLCIVNTRRDCRDLYALMPIGTIHLSALMCAQHRSEVIADLKSRLRSGQPVRVISTQLVEAGVDLDFPVVFRALAGLDSMAQAAGRCNREGQLPDGKRGKVVLFAPPKAPPPGLLRKGEEAGREMLRVWPEAATRLDPEAFKTYFELFYARVNNFDEKDIQGLLVTGASLGQFQFRSAADAFQLIDDTNQIGIVVRFGAHSEQVRKTVEAIRSHGPSRDRVRALQRFMVTVPEPVFRGLRDQGDIEDVAGLWVQAADELYDRTLGLCADRVRWNPERFVQ